MPNLKSKNASSSSFLRSEVVAVVSLSDSIFSLGDDDTTFQEPDLLRESTKQRDSDTKAAFPVLDAFKTNPMLTAGDLKDQVEFENTDKYQIQDAVQEALRRLHKKKVSDTHAKAKDTSKDIGATEIIDAVVKQLAGHDDINTDSSTGTETPIQRDSKPETKLHSKLEELSAVERKLFTLISEVKNILMKKDSESLDQHAESTFSNDIFKGIEDILSNKDTVKRSSIPTAELPNLDEFRRNSSLVDKFIDDAIPDDDDDNDDDDDDEDDDGEEDEKKSGQPIKGDVRDLLGKNDIKHALLKNAVAGEIENVPLSRLEEESEENDSVTSDRGIARDNLVESPFSSLDYKKTGKKFRHLLS